MPGLVVGAIWGWILAGDFGGAQLAFADAGSDEPAHFLAVRSRYFDLLCHYRQYLAWRSLQHDLLSVGLASIPADVYEAAELDGATRLQRFITITLPMMRAQLGAVISLGIIFTLQQFDLLPR